MDLKNDIPQNIVTIRYILALALIAILSTIAFFSLQIILKESEHTGEIVNISGKQRMLSQRIALDIHRIHHNVMSYPTEAVIKNKQILKDLQEHSKEMLKGNKILSTGVVNSKVTLELSPEINGMYFGDMNVSARVQEYVNIAQKIGESTNSNAIDTLIEMIDDRSEVLLRDLNKIVHQYQLEGEETLDYMQFIETVAWLLIIFTLLLEIIFIFQPMVKKIALVNSEKDALLKHLSDEVELRTMHLEKANRELNNLAFHDPLTGLKNRLNLEKDIQFALDKSHNFKAPYGVLMFDIDWFKTVNDTYGHAVGDKVLIELSEILISSVREEDKVYRAGGEEFVILLNRVSFEDTQKVAEKIRSLVQSHVFYVDDIEFSKTVSGGLFHSSLIEVANVKGVLKFVDNALYASKSNGRNCVTIAKTI